MKKSMSLLAVGFFALSLSSTAIFAEDEGGGDRGYGTAGCGLGAVLMGPKAAQIFASTTNYTVFNQFFAITIGTSNCTDDAVGCNSVHYKIDGVESSGVSPLSFNLSGLAEGIHSQLLNLYNSS